MSSLTETIESKPALTLALIATAGALLFIARESSKYQSVHYNFVPLVNPNSPPAPVYQDPGHGYISGDMLNNALEKQRRAILAELKQNGTYTGV